MNVFTIKKRKLSFVIVTISLLMPFLQTDGLCEEDQMSLKMYNDIKGLIESKNFDGAEALCKERIRLNPKDYIAITQLGEVYWHKDKKSAALKSFRKAAKIAPDYPTAHFWLGKAYLFRHKSKDAIKEFNIFIKKMGSITEMDEATTDFYISALHDISYLYSSLKRFDIITKLCKQIIKLRPDDQVAHFNLAVCYYNYYHKRPQAYKELEKVIEIDYATPIADRAKYFIDFIRRNPDSRFMSDFSFISEEK